MNADSSIYIAVVSSYIVSQKKLTPPHFETRAQLLLRWPLSVASEWNREEMGWIRFVGKLGEARVSGNHRQRSRAALL